MTCSFARAERLLGREYHGRFLIELLQNAADAWREDARSRESAWPRRRPRYGGACAARGEPGRANDARGRHQVAGPDRSVHQT